MYSVSTYPYTLIFKEPAGTSRGIYRTRNVTYILIEDEFGNAGVGECAPLPKLSCDDTSEYESVLSQACEKFSRENCIDYDFLRNYPSILFGFESSLMHLKANSLRLSDSAFSLGKKGIQINGLVWMGNFDEMYERIETKLKAGFRCVKLKIGAIDFEEEIALLAHIRKKFPASVIELRVDANGAFSPEEALNKLEHLSLFDLHSIEQPIKAGQWEEMARLCEASPIPIALDEELIGVNDLSTKAQLLDKIKPQYIILKPSLHGGFAGSNEWIKLAQERGIGYWATSALESNVGLNAIAHWCALQNTTCPQGLGTGQLYTNNIDFPLEIRGDSLYFNPKIKELTAKEIINFVS